MNGNSDEQEGAVNSGLGVAERDLLLRGLHQLADAPPPRDVWQRLAEQAEAEGLLQPARKSQRTHWFLGAGLAAAVLLAALRLPLWQPVDTESGPFPTEPAYVENNTEAVLDALMVRSQILEQNLRALPNKPSIMRVGTAATISELEDRIAAIDQVLSEPDASHSPAQIETYWRERVRLMDSLLQLRFAQARRSSI
ncbi:MAG: hypothetical protein RIA65_00875 [Woeseia sp.]